MDSVAEFVVIAVHERLELVLLLVGIVITRYVILVISNGIRDFHVQYVIKLIGLPPIKKWSNAANAISKYTYK